MNSFGKSMVVFVAATSLGFAAFALSLVTGGPNWKNEAESEEFSNDFLLIITPGEKPSYSIKDRRTDQAVGSANPLLAAVVVDGQKKQVTDAKAEETRLTAEIARLKPIIAEMKALAPPDREGLMTREETMTKVLAKYQEETAAVAAEFIAKSASIKQVQMTSQERRDEGFRMKNQLELLRTDLFVAQAQQRILEDELVRVEENRKRLERREQQLKKQVEPYAETDEKKVVDSRPE